MDDFLICLTKFKHAIDIPWYQAGCTIIKNTEYCVPHSLVSGGQLLRLPHLINFIINREKWSTKLEEYRMRLLTIQIRRNVFVHTKTKTKNKLDFDHRSLKLHYIHELLVFTFFLQAENNLSRFHAKEEQNETC